MRDIKNEIKQELLEAKKLWLNFIKVKREFKLARLLGILVGVPLAVYLFLHPMRIMQVITIVLCIGIALSAIGIVIILTILLIEFIFPETK